MSNLHSELTTQAALFTEKIFQSCQDNPVHGGFAIVSLLFALAFSVQMISATVSGEATKRTARGSKFAAFVSKKKLTIKDELFLAFLAEELENGKRPCYVITDPSLPDNPIIYASEGFCKFTKYSCSEIINRNCRFLQGERTDPRDVEIIRSAVSASKECSVQLLNYKKDGSTFVNQFFLMPLRAENQSVVYYIGVQKEVKPNEHSEGENAGWRIFMWL